MQNQHVINWKPEQEKPQAYQTVLLALVGDDLTTGYWASTAKCWMGYAFNQSPPMYKLEEGAVTDWAEINPPET